ncbi:MAG: DUF4249 domain-containing protein [Bacteroidota bacterium]
MNKYIAIIFLSSLFFSACQRDLNIPLPQHEPRLTLYAFLQAGEPIDLYVMRSFGILENLEDKDVAVADAKVELYKNGSLIDELQYKDTTFTDTLWTYTFSPGQGEPDTTIYYTEVLNGAKYFPSKILDAPKAGETYRFVATHPTYGTAEGETTIPAIPDLSGVKFYADSLSFVDSYGDEMNWSALDLKINDPVGEGNHYNFIIGVDYEVEDFQGGMEETRDWKWPGLEIISDPDGYTYIQNSPLSDEDFDGQISDKLWWFDLPESFRWSGQEPREVNYNRLLIQGISLSKEYAKFQEKLQLQTYNRLSGIESAFVPSEPIIIPNNVTGGYGVIGSFNVAEEYILELQ